MYQTGYLLELREQAYTDDDDDDCRFVESVDPVIS